MVQIIQAKQSPDTTADKFGKAFSNLGLTAASAIPEYMASRESKRNQAEQTKRLSSLTEQDLEGLSPELQAKILEGYLKEKQGLGLENQRLANKQTLQDERFQLYQQLLNGNSNPSQQSGQDLRGQMPNGVLSPEFGGAFPNQQNRSQQIGDQLRDGGQQSIPDNRQALAANFLDPNAARLLQHQQDVGLRENRAEREFDLQKRKASPEFKREQALESAQAQADVKYNQQLQEASKQHALKEQSLNNLETLNRKGVTGKAYEKLLEKAGLVNFTSDGRREFAADVKNLITDIRSILGAQFTGFEFQTILNAYPSADFSQGANAAIIRNLKNFQDIKSKEVQFAHQIKKENGGKIPLDFQSLVNERVHEYAATKADQIKNDTKKIINEEYGIPEGYTLMFDPKGEKLKVPEQDIEKYLDLGAILP